MPKYPVPMGHRFEDGFREMQRRLRTVETRTMGIDTGFPLMTVPAVIDPAYSGGNPMVFINGATTLTGPYQFLSSYTPAAGDHVLAVPVVTAQTYVILGRASGGTSAGFLAIPAAASDPTGAADSTPAIQAALDAATSGQAVYLPAGIYQTTAPLTLPPGVTLRGDAGWDAVTFGDAGTVIKPSASFTGASVLSMSDAGAAATRGCVITDLGIDGASLTVTADGISAFGPVVKTAIRNVAIANCTGWGVNNIQDPAVSSGNTHPYDWQVSHVRIHNCLGGGANLPDHTDSTWTDVYVLGCAQASGHGFQFTLAPANSHFIGCRSEWAGGSGDGWHLTGAWNNGNGSGGFTMTACSTDRSQGNGFYCDATGNTPVILNGCMFRRDGRNSGSGGGSYAAVQVNGATVPVLLNNISVYPGVDDNGSGTNSPQIGVQATSSRYVAMTGGFIHAATTAISDGGGNTAFRINPNIVKVTGVTTSPSFNYTDSWATDNGSDFTINGGGRIYTNPAVAPAVAAGAHAGTSPPAPVVTKATDMAGQITFGTGTGPSAGAQADVTFNRSYGTQPYIVLSAMNPATAALLPWVDSPTAAGFSVSTANAPAASQANTTYAVSWIILG